MSIKKTFQPVLFDFEITKQDIKKWVKSKIPSFVCRMKRKNEKKNDLLGDSNPRFSVIFPPTIRIFMEGVGDEIKSRGGS